MSEKGRATITCKVHFANGVNGRKVICKGKKKAIPIGRVPRVARLMALAIHLEKELADGKLRSYDEIANVGSVSPARVSQVMSFLMLASDIQEELLFLPRIMSGRDPITERDLRPIMKVGDWTVQRSMWIEVQEVGLEP